MKKTTRFIALVCAILMMLCLCACGMSNSEQLLGEAAFRSLADELSSGSVSYEVEYSKRGDLDVTITINKANAFDEYNAAFDSAAKDLLTLDCDIFVTYANNNKVELDDIKIFIVDADGNVQYKSVNGNIVKTPW